MRLLSLDPWKTQYVFEIKPRVDKVTSLFIDRFLTDLCLFLSAFGQILVSSYVAWTQLTLLCLFGDLYTPESVKIQVCKTALASLKSTQHRTTKCNTVSIFFNTFNF